MRADKWTRALARVLDRIRLGPRRKTRRFDNWEIVPRLPEALEDHDAEPLETPRSRNLPVLLLLTGALVWLIVQPPVFFPKPEDPLDKPLALSPVSPPPVDSAASTPQETRDVSVPSAISAVPAPSSVSPAPIPSATPGASVVTVHPKVRAREAKVVVGDDDSDRFKVMPDPETPPAAATSQP